MRIGGERVNQSKSRTWPKTVGPIPLRAAVLEPNCGAQQSWLCPGNAQSQRLPENRKHASASAHVPVRAVTGIPALQDVNRAQLPTKGISPLLPLGSTPNLLRLDEKWTCTETQREMDFPKFG